MVNSRQKGARGEREWRDFLVAHNIWAKRGQQHAGGPDSPDVISELDWVHWEVKRTESINIHKAYQQAKDDSGGTKIPVVAHKRNRDEWKVILGAEDFLAIVGSLTDYQRMVLRESLGTTDV